MSWMSPNMKMGGRFHGVRFPRRLRVLRARRIRPLRGQQAEHRGQRHDDQQIAIRSMQTIISFLRSLCAGEGRRMMEINCF